MEKSNDIRINQRIRALEVVLLGACHGPAAVLPCLSEQFKKQSEKINESLVCKHLYSISRYFPERKEDVKNLIKNIKNNGLLDDANLAEISKFIKEVKQFINNDEAG
ncbi:MAG: hypothetical protein ACYCSQ_00525 [bacterium]